MRATTWIERSGIPAAAVICAGFISSAHVNARMLGLQSLRVVEYPPPNIGAQTSEEIKERVGTLLDKISEVLTKPATEPKVPAVRESAVKPREIVYRGTFEEINNFFYDHKWTDGLPIIPPTIEAVEAMLKFTDRSPGDTIGILQPSCREATVWAVAVNGVMAGCRPEYMPLLVALIEAIAEPRFGLQHAGSTAGWTPLIILNGPIVKQLEFQTGQGVLRPHQKANVTIGRFLRLAMVNLAGFEVGSTDMACFGSNYFPVLAEAEDESPYESLSVNRGFNKGDNVVTVTSCLSMSYHFTSQGTAHDHLEILANEAKRELGGQYVQVMTIFGPEISPVLCMSPLVATELAKAGHSKQDIRKYIYEHARITASEFDRELGGLWPGFTIQKAVEDGMLSGIFLESEDPERLVPVMHSPDELLIVVSGSSSRNRNFITKQTGNQGLAVSKEIKIPATMH
ncbi:hypothetical protein ACFLXC_06915 [Chloroflexota bacterium]